MTPQQILDMHSHCVDDLTTDFPDITDAKQLQAHVTGHRMQTTKIYDGPELQRLWASPFTPGANGNPNNYQDHQRIFLNRVGGIGPDTKYHSLAPDGVSPQYHYVRMGELDSWGNPTNPGNPVIVGRPGSVLTVAGRALAIAMVAMANDIKSMRASTDPTVNNIRIGGGIIGLMLVKRAIFLLGLPTM